MQKVLANIPSSIAGLSLFLMMALTFADVIARYFINSPIEGATEYISFLLAIVLYGGLPAVTRDKGHISVGILTSHFPTRLKQLEDVATLCITFAMTAFIAYLMFQQALYLQADQALTPYLDMPIAPLVYFLGLLSLVATAFAALHFYWKIFPQANPFDDRHTP